ncbi:hypothetical protein CKC_03695 [Candidatus Liberibacter solanacearum CLso-ZC1]|uniref:Uncharacterized protein n=2 Tax=Candidatus Liberibacter solanacearum TaxID=556287 RepID=E4UBI2_LIBSC|nr:hypothetical protein CKC_03695 [Candidatus Liberibacter solanacearum CLso-ZC1]
MSLANVWSYSMISTASISNLILSDKVYKKSIATISKDPIVSREEKYYREKIKKISTVEEFINDKRLLNYVLKAFDLSDMSHAKTFLQKILTSDLSVPESLVNKMNSKKYQTFASQFDFSPAPKSIQTTIQQKKVIEDYITSYKRKEKDALEESKYFRQNINNITSVDQLIKNRRLVNYALQSFGINPQYISLSFLKESLTSELDHTKQKTPKENLLHALADNFRFQSNGSPIHKDKILTNMQIENMVHNYFSHTIMSVPEEVIFSDQKYYRSSINSIPSFEQLLKDPKLYKILQISLSLDPKVTENNFLKLIKNNDPSIVQVKKFFQIDYAGDINSRPAIQTKKQIDKLLFLYQTNCKKLRSQKIESLIENYKKDISGDIKSVDQFLNMKPKSYISSNKSQPITPLEFALQAYGIKKNDLNKYRLRDILISDSSDSKSYVNQLKDNRFINLHHAFNFNKKGEIGFNRLTQSKLTLRDNVMNYIGYKKSLYNENKIFSSAQNIRIKKDTDKEVEYYTSNIQTIHSFNDLLANKRILNFLLESKEIDPKKVKNSFLEKIFKSDLNNTKSLANTYKDSRYKEIMLSFNFDIHGTKSNENTGKVQDNFHIDHVVDLYKNQILQKKEEEKDPDVALLLYFKRTIPTIKNIYDILGDKNLFQVISKKLRLSPHFPSLPESTKIHILKKLINIKDFKDPKKLENFLYAVNVNHYQSTTHKIALTLAFFPPLEKDSMDDHEKNISLQLSPNKKENGKFSILNLFS